jgi:hypothetical protein
MWQVRGREQHSGGGSLMEREHLEDLGVDRDILKLILNK